MVAPVTSHIGGSMYGDGEYVVNFENIHSAAPLKAVVLCPSGAAYEMTPNAELYTKPSVKLAQTLVTSARIRERSNEGATT